MKKYYKEELKRMYNQLSTFGKKKYPDIIH